MSTDYIAACRACKVRRHIGQRMGGQSTLGYGSQDVQGQAGAVAFLFDHAGCDGDCVVMESDNGFLEPEYDYAQHPDDA